MSTASFSRNVSDSLSDSEFSITHYTNKVVFIGSMFNLPMNSHVLLLVGLSVSMFYPIGAALV